MPNSFVCLFLLVAEVHFNGPAKAAGNGEVEPQKTSLNVVVANPLMPPTVHAEYRHKLRTILDSNSLFPNWISITNPSVLGVITNTSRTMNIEYSFLLGVRNISLSDQSGIPLKASPRIVDAMKRWLLAELSCSVDFVWTQLPGYYWPHWIRSGYCVSQRSCQWPPGMTCQSRNQKKLAVLRWGCDPDPNQRFYRAAKKQYDENKRRMRHQREVERSRRFPPTSGRLGIRNRSRWKSMGRLQRARRVKSYVYQLSQSYFGMYCKWSKVPYTVTEFCACACRL